MHSKDGHDRSEIEAYESWVAEKETDIIGAKEKNETEEYGKQKQAIERTN